MASRLSQALRLGFDYLTILVSGHFASVSYARTYLGSRLRAPVALLHYVVLGEARGYRPCPFFDPERVRGELGGPGGALPSARQASGTLFAAFLRDGARAVACAEFDPAWYAERHPDLAGTGLSAWLHYARFGLERGEDPSPDVSVAFLQTAYTAGRRPLAQAFHRVFARRDQPENRLLPLSAEALRRNQAALRASVTLEIRRSRPQRRHADLVFVQTSGRHPSAIEGDGRGYDLMLNYYCDADGEPPGADYILRQNGTKVTAINLLLAAHPDLLLRYDRILFLDDDVEIAPAAIEHLFATMASEGLDLSQPALTQDSQTYFGVLRQSDISAPCRRVSAVEIMAPAFSRRGLEAAAGHFSRGVSGYGLDILIGAEIRRRFGATIAVIDGAVARHATPVDTQNGPFYRYLRSFGIDPIVEMRHLFSANGEVPEIHEL